VPYPAIAVSSTWRPPILPIFCDPEVDLATIARDAEAPMIRPIHSFTLFALLAGCVDNDADAPMRIVANLAPSESCLVDPSAGAFQDDGVIDTQAGAGYLFTPGVVNELTTIEGEALGPKTIYIERADVDIAFYDTTTFDAANFPEADLHFSTPTSGSIEPNGGQTGFSFEIVPIRLIRALEPLIEGTDSDRTTLDVRIQMFGVRGGNSVHSQVFRYPVQVCIGCTVAELGPCDLLPSDFTGSTGGVCQTFQDGVLQCCDNLTVCPAQPPMGT
jgi:hypothetical protein